MSWQGHELVHVVAVDQQHCIGVNNSMPWHLPRDFQHFRELTQGGVVVMGRKTFESIGRPLPKRINIVLTRQTDWQADGVQVTHSLDDALNLAAQQVQQQSQQQEQPQDKATIFVIGGADFYTQTLPLADRLELTHVALDVHGDAFYPAIPADFVAGQPAHHVDEKSGVSFAFVQYLRRGAV